MPSIIPTEAIAIQSEGGIQWLGIELPDRAWKEKCLPGMKFVERWVKSWEERGHERGDTAFNGLSVTLLVSRGVCVYVGKLAMFIASAPKQSVFPITSLCLSERHVRCVPRIDWLILCWLHDLFYFLHRDHSGNRTVTQLDHSNVSLNQFRITIELQQNNKRGQFNLTCLTINNRKSEKWSLKTFKQN